MKKILMFISLLLGFAGSSYADDQFSVDNITLPQNGEADVVVRFSLDEGNTCRGYELWLQLPEGLEFLADGTDAIYTPGDCYNGAAEIAANLNEGYLKVVWTSTAGKALKSQSGTLVSFKVKPTGTPTVGTIYTCNLTNGKISPENGSAHDVANTSCTISISDPLSVVTLNELSTTAPTASSGAVNVVVNRTIKADEWSTICLPFDMSEAQVKAAFGNDVELADFTGWSFTGTEDNVESINITFTSKAAIVKHRPYVIKVTKAMTSFQASNVVITTSNKPRTSIVFEGEDDDYTGTMNGTYKKGTVSEGHLFLADNKFWFSTGETNIKGFRATFNLGNIAQALYESDASSRIFMQFNDQPTGIRNIKSSEDGKYFDLLGRGVKPTKKGLYIKDGKKVVIK